MGAWWKRYRDVVYHGYTVGSLDFHVRGPCVITIDSVVMKAHDDLTFTGGGATMAHDDLTFKVIGATMKVPPRPPAYYMTKSLWQ